jgi:hypothetical protein
VAALRVAPSRKSVSTAGEGHGSRNAYRINYRPGFTVADEVGMRFGRAKARIIRGGHDIAMFDERPKSLDLLKKEDCERRRAAGRYAGSRMRPGDDWTALWRRITWRNYDHT